MDPDATNIPPRTSAGSPLTRLWLPGLLTFLVGLVLLVVGIATMPARFHDETFAVGAPAYAALFVQDGPIRGRAWLLAGTALTVVGGLAALMVSASAARRRRAGHPGSEGRVSRKPVASVSVVVTLGLGLLAIGLSQVPRDVRDELGGFRPDEASPRDEQPIPSVPIALDGRGSLDAGTVLVAVGGLILLGAEGTRRRQKAGAT